MSVLRQTRVFTAIFLIALVMGVRIVGALDAAHYGDPYHSHHGEPCVIKLLLESGPSGVDAALRGAEKIRSYVRYIPFRRQLATTAARRAHTIRGPPSLSI